MHGAAAGSETIGPPSGKRSDRLNPPFSNKSFHSDYERFYATSLSNPHQNK
jgi:hypothetical protein